MNSVFSEKDRLQMAEKGVKAENVLQQLEIFEKGIPPIKLLRPCTVDDGIKVLKDFDKYIKKYSEAEADGRVMKFVPASGAASRMFRELIRFNNEYDEIEINEIEKKASNSNDHNHLLKFIKGIKEFAFYEELRTVLSNKGVDIEERIQKGQYKEIVDAVIADSGLNYAFLPKALIKFHAYGNESRAAIEEHLVEAAAYCRDKNGTARIHFTLSPEHEQIVNSHIESVLSRYENENCRFEIGYSFQKPSTDTIAVDMQNNPFRLEDGSLLFRPGGHGALLDNLNELNGDIITIKNIDNIVPDRLKSETYKYKRVLGGYLVGLQQSLFDHLDSLTGKGANDATVKETMEFAREELSLHIPDMILEASIDAQKDFLISKLNRPIRVCGMVKNEGEPGGGPFWVEERDGNISRQVAESAQVNLEDPGQEEIWKSATHFSPVDFICGVRDFNGQPFNLMKFRDPDAGFITKKSQDGRALKALELPGLWNGSMANWITIFVEVPIITFNPVKTILDLLRPNHQPKE